MSNFVTVNPGIDAAALQALIDQLAQEGLGTGIFMAPGIYELKEPLRIRTRTWLFGQGDGESTHLRMNACSGLIFDPGFLEARVEKLSLGEVNQPEKDPNIGIDLAGSQRNYVAFVRVSNFGVGIRLSSEQQVFSGYNAVAHFVVLGCHVGFRAEAQGNNISVRDGRVLGPNTPDSVGIEVSGGAAVTFDAVTSEGSGVQARVTGAVKCSFTNCYFEGIADNPNAKLLVDVAPDTSLGEETTVLWKGNYCEGEGRFVAPPEALLETDTNGTSGRWAARHPASAAGRNLVRNGDFHQFGGGVFANFFPFGQIAIGPDADHVSATRSLRISPGGAQDPQAQVACQFRCPDVVGALTIGIRFKMIAGVEPWVVLEGGEINPPVELPPGPAGVWREEFVTGRAAPTTNGAIRIFPFQAGPATLLIDEIWLVAGRVAAPSRAYGERIERFEQPLLLVKADGAGPGQTAIHVHPTGLAEPPPSAIAALLRLEVVLTAGTGPATLAILDAGPPHPRAHSLFPQHIATQDVSVRFTGTIQGWGFLDKAGDVAQFHVWLLGWVVV